MQIGRQQSQHSQAAACHEKWDAKALERIGGSVASPVVPSGQILPDAKRVGQQRPGRAKQSLRAEAPEAGEANWPLDDCGWGAEPDVCRVAHGVPDGMDRIGSLGNAVVPQIPEMIGYAILEAEAA